MMFHFDMNGNMTTAAAAADASFCAQNFSLLIMLDAALLASIIFVLNSLLISVLLVLLVVIILPMQCLKVRSPILA